jgi:5-methyltetrahydrofolate--homocysteine methyltransferase
MSNPLTNLLNERDYLLADGATGTNMMAMGLPAGQAADLWNLQAPEKVTDLHSAFVKAGADIILTNTFSANRFRLSLDHAEHLTTDINVAAARLARAASQAAEHPVIVAGAMGPTGELMQPHGSMTHESALAAFTEQANALAEGGVDVIWIETIYAFDELLAAVTAAASTGLPVASTMTFDTAGRTMMGNTPEQASEFMHSSLPQLIAYGANCGAGPSMLVDTISKFSRCANDNDIIIAKGNCGIPQSIDGQIVYSGDDETMWRYARLVRDCGARIIGGCCGTTPARLKTIASALQGYTPGNLPDVETIEASLGPIQKSKKRSKRQNARTNT